MKLSPQTTWLGFLLFYWSSFLLAAYYVLKDLGGILVTSMIFGSGVALFYFVLLILLGGIGFFVFRWARKGKTFVIFFLMIPGLLAAFTFLSPASSEFQIPFSTLVPFLLFMLGQIVFFALHVQAQSKQRV